MEEQSVVLWVTSTAVVAATILGPVLAVQVQKYLERRQAADRERRTVFAALMYTRATRLSPEHIQAVNRIEIAFYKNIEVMTAFKNYLDLLNTPTDGDEGAYVFSKRNDAFIDLLFSMSQLLEYRFSKIDLKKNAYIPQGHVDLDLQQQKARELAMQILEGKAPIRVSLDQR